MPPNLNTLLHLFSTSFCLEQRYKHRHNDTFVGGFRTHLFSNLCYFVSVSSNVAFLLCLMYITHKMVKWQRILSVQYSIPDYVRISVECIQLLSRIFVADPEKRITIPEIEKHLWFLKNLPIEQTEEGEASLQMSNDIYPSQSIEEVLAIIKELGK